MNYKKIFEDNNLTTIESFFDFAQNNFYYGWVDQNGNKHKCTNDAQLYCLQSPAELLKNEIGNCWDMTELHRCFFETMTSLKYETYYLLYEDNKGCPSHSILVFYKDDKVYWFEPLFNNNHCYYSGIHEYKNILELLKDFKQVFIKHSLLTGLIPQDYNINNFYVYKYEQPQYHLNGHEMRYHIDNSILINI